MELRLPLEVFPGRQATCRAVFGYICIYTYEYCSLPYTVRPCCLSILYVKAYICNPKFPLCPSSKPLLYPSSCCFVTSVMSDSVRPHTRQPTRLPRPWDSPGRNTGVGCHFLFQCMKVKSESEVAQSCPILSNPMDCSLPGSCFHGIFQARVLEWGAIAFSDSKPSHCKCVKAGM